MTLYNVDVHYQQVSRPLTCLGADPLYQMVTDITQVFCHKVICFITIDLHRLSERSNLHQFLQPLHFRY